MAAFYYLFHVFSFCLFRMGKAAFSFTCSMGFLESLFLQMSSILASGIYRVVLESGVSEDDNVDNYDKLSKAFNLFSPKVAFEFRKLLGCRWLEICPNISYFELLSRFVTICYDVILDVDLVCLLVSTFIFSSVLNRDMVFSALDDYHFDVGSFIMVVFFLAMSSWVMAGLVNYCLN